MYIYNCKNRVHPNFKIIKMSKYVKSESKINHFTFCKRYPINCFYNWKGFKNMKIAYVRVSTIEQNEARQVEALEKYTIEKWFIDKVSAKNTDRPKLKEMLEFMREGDIVYIHDFSRLARSTSDLLNLVELFKTKKVNLVSNKENIDTSTPSGKLMLTMIGAINEFERDNLLERQREGIVIAKREGKYKGGKKKQVKNFDFYYNQYQNREINKTELAKQLKISRPTLYKIIKEFRRKG